MTAATSETLLDVLPGDNDAVQQVEQWFRDYHATGDPAVRERIILAHLGLADRLAARFRRSHGVSRDDLVQAARVGLVAAVNRYDPDRANPFVVYAIACISGELRRCLRDTSWRVHVARTVKERAIKVARTHSALTATLERAPTTEEIADHLGMSKGRVVEALEAMRTRSELSLDQPATEDGTISMGALLPAPASGVDLEDLLILPQLIGGLPELERRAVLLWFFDELKQHEIGPLLGCSQVHVSRLLRRALTSMREQLLE
jgi:RNA polymerase sigma-B factor